MEEEKRREDEAQAIPQGPAPGRESPVGPTSSGVDPKLAAFLSYLLSIFISFLGGLIFYLIEQENKFTRFHALQAVFFNVAVIVLSIALTIITIILFFAPIIGWIAAVLLWLVFGIGAFVYWIVLMIKSLQGEYYKIPYLGDLADRNS